MHHHGDTAPNADSYCQVHLKIGRVREPSVKRSLGCCKVAQNEPKRDINEVLWNRNKGSALSFCVPANTQNNKLHRDKDHSQEHNQIVL